MPDLILHNPFSMFVIAWFGPLIVMSAVVWLNGRGR